MNHTTFLYVHWRQGEKHSIPRPSLFLRLTSPHRQADWRTGEEWASFYLAGIFARFRAIASSTAFSCFSSSSRRESVLLGLLEPEPVAEAEPGTAGLPNGAGGPFPDNLGGGDRGRFLRERKRSSVYIFYSCQYIQADMTWLKKQRKYPIINTARIQISGFNHQMWMQVWEGHHVIVLSHQLLY